MDKKYKTNSPSGTKQVGEKFAGEIIKKGTQEEAVVFGLSGELGGGKTTFLQGFAKALRIKEKVLSPTFILMNRFEIPKPGFSNFFHIDCYRIDKEEEIEKLGFEEIVSNEENIVAVEWADKIPSLLPEDAIKIEFNIADKNTREIVINNF